MISFDEVKINAVEISSVVNEGLGVDVFSFSVLQYLCGEVKSS